MEADRFLSDDSIEGRIATMNRMAVEHGSADEAEAQQAPAFPAVKEDFVLGDEFLS